MTTITHLIKTFTTFVIASEARQSSVVLGRLWIAASPSAPRNDKMELSA